MSEEQLKSFLEKVQGDTSLQEKLKAAADSDAVLAIAKEAGFSFSADGLIKAQQEVTEDELGGVSGRGETSFEKDLVKYVFFDIDIFALPSALKDRLGRSS